MIHFGPLTNKKLLLPLQCKLNADLSPDAVKLAGYLASPVIAVPSKPCVGPSPRTKISLFLLSTCTDGLILAPKITTFLP